jgi:hypothetical protein
MQRPLFSFQVRSRLHARTSHEIEEDAFKIVRKNLHRHTPHGGKEGRARAVNIIDIFPADDRAYRQLATQDAKTQVDAFFAIKVFSMP